MVDLSNWMEESRPLLGSDVARFEAADRAREATNHPNIVKRIEEIERRLSRIERGL